MQADRGAERGARGDLTRGGSLPLVGGLWHAGCGGGGAVACRVWRGGGAVACRVGHQVP